MRRSTGLAVALITACLASSAACAPAPAPVGLSVGGCVPGGNGFGSSPMGSSEVRFQHAPDLSFRWGLEACATDPDLAAFSGWHFPSFTAKTEAGETVRFRFSEASPGVPGALRTIDREGGPTPSASWGSPLLQPAQAPPDLGLGDYVTSVSFGEAEGERHYVGIWRGPAGLSSVVYFTLDPNGRAMRQALIGETALRLDQVSYQFASHGSPVQLSFLAEPATGRFELLAFDWRAEDTQARLRRIQ